MKIIVLLLFPFLGFSQIKLVNTELLNGKVEILLPAKLTAMSQENWELKYHTSNKPTMVLSDANGEVNLIADHTSQSLAENQLLQYEQMRVQNLLKNHPDIQKVDSSIQVVNGHQLGVVKFISQAVDQKIFNCYFFTVVGGRVLFFTFNCIESLESKWEKTVDEIIASVTLK